MIEFKDVGIGRSFKNPKGAELISIPECSYQDEFGETHKYNCVYLDEGRSHFQYYEPTEMVELIDTCEQCHMRSKIDGDYHCMRLDIPLVDEPNLIGAENYKTFTCANFKPKEGEK